MNIRPATHLDCAAITTFWNPIIRHTDITFNSAEKTPEQLADELVKKAALDHPFVIAEIDGEIQGFATYGQFRASNGYAKTMEHTIILPDRARGQGLGRRLMATIEDHARERGVHSMFAGISHSNAAGIAFHTAAGYSHVARLPEVGYKFDRWYDLVLMQKIL